MLELLIIVFLVAIGWFAGQGYAYWQVRDILRDYARREGIDIDDEYNIKEPNPINKITLNILKVEQIKDVLYLYDVANDKFVCQAETLDALAYRVKEINYTKLAGVIYNDDKLWFVDGKVFKTLEEVAINES